MRGSFFAVLLAVLSLPAWSGENGKKPITPEKALWDFGVHICSYQASSGEEQHCDFDIQKFVKANPAPCAAKDRAVAKLRMAQAICEWPWETKEKGTGAKVVKIQPKHAAACWKVVVNEVTGKNPEPFKEGQQFDLSKLNEAVAWAGATCVGSDRYRDIDAECMHGKIEALEVMFSLQGINEGPAPATFACAEGAGDPVLAEGQVAPARPEVQPRIVTTAELPSGSGAAVVK